jgi:hypothetical protein
LGRVARLHQHKLLRSAKLILEQGWKKSIADHKKNIVHRTEVNSPVARISIRTGKLSGANDKQITPQIEATPAHYIKDVRRPVKNALITMRKLQLGPKLVEKLRRSMDKLG